MFMPGMSVLTKLSGNNPATRNEPKEAGEIPFQRSIPAVALS